MESLSHSLLAFAWIILVLLASGSAFFLSYQSKTKSVAKRSLIFLLGLNLCLSGVGYLALDTGEVEEEKVEGIVEKKMIQTHESVSEIAVGFASLATIIGVVVLFIKFRFQSLLLILMGSLGLVSGALGFSSHSKGRDIVSARKSEPVYDKKEQGMMEKAPGTFSTTPNVNESFKADENDYEGVEDDTQLEDDDKQED